MPAISIHSELSVRDSTGDREYALSRRITFVFVEVFPLDSGDVSPVELVRD